MSRLFGWSLNRVLVLMLAGAYFGLSLELRYEHVDVIRRHHWLAWIPPIFSTVMFVVCLAGVGAWRRWGRLVLEIGFGLSIVVGLLGFYLHNGSHLGQNLGEMIGAWFRTEKLADRPPTLAPLTFCGFGIIGLLACFWPAAPEPQPAESPRAS